MHALDRDSLNAVVCEVTDSGAPPLTRYQRVVVTVTP
jgi:hypothetical protein